MDCSDLNRFLNNEMTDEEQKIFKEHTKQCKVCKIQTEFYNSLEINNIPPLPENFEVSVMVKIHNKAPARIFNFGTGNELSPLRAKVASKLLTGTSFMI